MNRVDKFLDKCKRHKIVSVFVVVGIIVIAIGSFTDALQKIVAPFRKQEPVKVLLVQGTDTRPIKDRIRSYLRTVNPKIIELLDSGQPSVAVMINTVNQPALVELQKDPDFGEYLEVHSTGSVSTGAHNTIGGHLNDLQDVGMLNGYEFVFKDRLKLE
jgi:vacuolar-type H+-ATPase subunit F/Vma7